MIKKVIDINVPYGKFDCKHDEVQSKLTVYDFEEGEFEPMIDRKQKNPAVIVCPGGAYWFLCDREGEVEALEFAKNGVTPFLMEYSVYPNKFPAALMEIAEAVRYVREHHEELNIDKDRIYVAGSSAGGHLTASLGSFWNEDFLSEALETDKELLKPNGIILSYPVITAGEYTHFDSCVNLMGDNSLKSYEEHVKYLEASPYYKYMSVEKMVHKDSVPAFIWTTFGDTLVPIENSLLFVKSMKDAGVPVEFHLFPYADHGMSIANEAASQDEFKRDVQPYIARWVEWAAKWIERNCDDIKVI